MSAKPLSSTSESTDKQPAEPAAVNNVVEIKTGVGAVLIHRNTLEISWPGAGFHRIVDAEDLMNGLKQAVVAAEEMIFERSREHAPK